MTNRYSWDGQFSACELERLRRRFLDDMWRDIEITGREPNSLLDDLPMTEPPPGPHRYEAEHKMPEEPQR